VLTQRPRVIALCLFRRDDRILVTEVLDGTIVKGYRPLGGGVEFGERTIDAVAREIREELGVEVTGLRLVTVLENIFTHEGKQGHEIVFVYDGESADPTLYDREPFSYMDVDVPARALWKRIGDFSDDAPLFPTGLLEQLLRT